ncbi:unnamed protein product, partial [Amoebophrya sp. A120]|eukprot:GSA120T00025273001.1
MIAARRRLANPMLQVQIPNSRSSLGRSRRHDPHGAGGSANIKRPTGNRNRLPGGIEVAAAVVGNNDDENRPAES